MVSERVPRTVTYSHRFDLAAKKLDKLTARREELMRGIEWAFARSSIEGPVRVRARLSANGPVVIVTGEVGKEMVEIDTLEIE